MKKLLAILLSALMLASILTFVACKKSSNSSDPNEQKYNEACSLIQSGKYTEAYDILLEIKDYQPASEKLKCFVWAPETAFEITETGRFKTKTYTYDDLGNICTMTDGESNFYSFTYIDGLVSSGPYLTDEYHSNSGYYIGFGSEASSYTYKDGRIYQIRNDSERRILTYEYNENGQIKRILSDPFVPDDWNRTLKYEFEYTYDSEGRVSSVSYYGVGYGRRNATATYAYDNLGRIQSINFTPDPTDRFPIDPWEITFSYNNYGVSEIVYREGYNSLNLQYTYNSNGALSSIKMQAFQNGMLNNSSDFTYAGINTIEIEFGSHKLIYSENPEIINRISYITYTNVENENSFLTISDILF